MPYPKTSQRGEQRAVRERMRSLGLSYQQIAVEFARRYQLRPRPAWRNAWGWSLTEAAGRISDYAARAGLGLDGKTVAMTAPHLSEYENWPGPGSKPSGRRPTPYLLSLLAAVYECSVQDLLDLSDFERMPAADRLVISKTVPEGTRQQQESSRLVPGASVSGRPDASRDGPAGTGTAPPVRPGPLAGWPLGRGRLPDPRPACPATGVGGWPVPSDPVLPGRTGEEGPGWVPRPGEERGVFRQAVTEAWPTMSLSVPVPDQGVDWQVRFPAGRAFDMPATLAVQVHPMMTAADGSGYLPVAGGSRLEHLAAGPQRAMLIGVGEQPDGSARLFGVDLRDAHRTITGSPGVPSAITVPHAYELDDLSYGIIWALISLDDALLADDSILDERTRQFHDYDLLPDASVDRQAAAGLTAAARMLLGSSFCARYILRHIDRPSELPVFWTREQTGEEACTWLLFRHKHSYLRQISSQFTGGPDPLERGFCVPESAVRASARWERVLLFLSAALMESLGIRVVICTEPDYADTDGFVLLPGSRAIIATWVRADGAWCTATADSGPDVRGFADVTGHARARSLTGGSAPDRRLMALAGYLDLDWAWLWQRCADLGGHGLAGLIQPRSRLLSTQALEAALRFTGDLGRQAAAR